VSGWRFGSGSDDGVRMPAVALCHCLSEASLRRCCSCLCRYQSISDKTQSGQRSNRRASLQRRVTSGASEVRIGLAAGGRWIRTLGPRLSSATSMSREKGLVAGKMTFRGDDLTTRQRRTPRKRRSALDPFCRLIRTRMLSCAPATTQTLNGTSPPREAHSRYVETIDRARPRANSSSRPCATFTTSPVDRWAGRARTYPDHDDLVTLMINRLSRAVAASRCWPVWARRMI
jgi:hypothetical protein